MTRATMGARARKRQRKTRRVLREWAALLRMIARFAATGWQPVAASGAPWRGARLDAGPGTYGAFSLADAMRVIDRLREMEGRP